ncbi:MAG: hypothetical protein J0M04_18200 [Verrucomicrobia bacterium]|nr:hypothetical protein [Verrucomicrobiota bacterium]
MNHWHAWVDNCLGRKAELRTPFKEAARITITRQIEEGAKGNVREAMADLEMWMG